MNIKTSSLKTFQKLASSIKTNGIIPITDQLKFEPGRITKSALTSFVQFYCEEVTEAMLIDEKQLFNLVGSTTSDFIIITKKDNKVTISDTVTKLTIQSPGIKEFPSIPIPEGEIVELSTEFMEGLYMASFFSVEKEVIPTIKSFIMIGNNSLSASDGFIVFTKPIKESFKVVIEKRIAVIVSKIPVTKYASAVGYDFFYSKDTTFGFSKHEIGFFDMTKVFSIEGKPSFTADSNDLLNFNHLAVQSVGIPFVCMTKGKLTMYDSDRDIDLSRPMECLNIDKEFTYLPGQMNRILSAISCSEVDFYPGENRFYIKSQDADFTTLIQGAARP